MSSANKRSADSYGGWKNHYCRMNRWKVRSLKALNNLPASDFQDAIDYSLAYFLWSHSLKEWLIEDGVFDKSTLYSLLEQHDIWPLCCDVANRVRHLNLTRHVTDNDWSAHREYDPFSPVIEGRERHTAHILFEGKKRLISDAIMATAAMWEEIVPKG